MFIFFNPVIFSFTTILDYLFLRGFIEIKWICKIYINRNLFILKLLYLLQVIYIKNAR